MVFDKLVTTMIVHRTTRRLMRTLKLQKRAEKNELDACLKLWVITARNEVEARLHRRLWFFSGGGGGVVSQHALQVVSQHALQQVSRGLVVSLAGFQARTQEGSLGGSGQGGLQAHTQEGSLGIWSGGCLQAHTRGRGLLTGVCVCSQGETPWDSYCCGQYASY